MYSLLAQHRQQGPERSPRPLKTVPAPLTMASNTTGIAGEAAPVTQADSLNGIEWKGQVALYATAVRAMNHTGAWSAWRDTANQPLSLGEHIVENGVLKPSSGMARTEPRPQAECPGSPPM